MSDAKAYVENTTMEKKKEALLDLIDFYEGQVEEIINRFISNGEYLVNAESDPMYSILELSSRLQRYNEMILFAKVKLRTIK